LEASLETATEATNMDRLTDFITQIVCGALILGILGFIGTLVAISLFGPQLPKLLQGLPW